MPAPTTRSAMLQQVTAATDASEGEYDVEAITDELIAQHGHVDIDDIDAGAFWGTVAAHEVEPAADPAEQFRADLSAAIAAAPAGTPATWTDGTVTLTVTGASRVSHAWPQPLAQIAITTPDGDSEQVDGWAQVASWDELWARVQAAGETWATDTDILVAQLAGAHAGLERAERAATQARARRDTLVREAAAAGVSAYRIAKRLGVAESTVGRILSRP